MERIQTVAGQVRRAGPSSGAVGGLLFFAYWYVRAREVALPQLAGTLVDVATFLLLGAGLLSYQLAQGLLPGAWVGWAGLTALLQGLTTSPVSVCFGLVLLGIAIARSGVHPRVPGLILASSGFLLLLTVYFASGFGRGHAEMGLLGRATMGLALVGVAAALVDLRFRDHVPEGTAGAARPAYPRSSG